MVIFEGFFGHISGQSDRNSMKIYFLERHGNWPQYKEEMVEIEAIVFLLSANEKSRHADL